ncbi:PorV/PorQ family protein [bacterium]|nr:PorV/PorQ family protein [bacterium]MBU1634583.1 PorV/PorQ family protein [bacterium]
MLKKVIIVFFLLQIFVFAQYERPGSNSAQFLKIAVSPRAAGMGDSYISVTDGAEATHYNAAALAWIKNGDVTFSHTEWFAGINHEFASAAKTFERLGTFALSYTGLHTDEMKVRTPLQPDGTGETFYAGSYRIGLSYSRFLTDRVTFGTTINYINISLYSDFSADAVAIDIATLYVTKFRNFRFGMKISNFGSEIQFVNESYPLPTNFTFGLSVNAIDGDRNKLLVSITAIKPNDVQPLGLIGTEWNYQNILFLRTGYRINHKVAKYSFGGGIKKNIGKHIFHFDYAYSDFSLLGGSHCFGVRLVF